MPLAHLQILAQRPARLLARADVGDAPGAAFAHERVFEPLLILEVLEARDDGRLVARAGAGRDRKLADLEILAVVDEVEADLVALVGAGDRGAELLGEEALAMRRHPRLLLRLLRLGMHAIELADHRDGILAGREGGCGG